MLCLCVPVVSVPHMLVVASDSLAAQTARPPFLGPFGVLSALGLCVAEQGQPEESAPEGGLAEEDRDKAQGALGLGDAEAAWFCLLKEGQG